MWPFKKKTKSEPVERDYPIAAVDNEFNLKVQELKVVGGLYGLGIRANYKGQNSILVYPRLGRQIKTLDDMLLLEWYDLDDTTGVSFRNYEPQKISKTEIKEFLKNLAR